MRKKWSTLAFGFLVAAYAHIRIKEKRSVKSYMLEQGIRLSRAKRRFMYKEEAMKALEKMAPQTAGEYEGTNYQFKMPVKVDKHFGSTVYTVNDKQDKHQRVVLYAHGGAWFQDPLKIHFEFIDELAETLNAKVIMPVYPKIPHQDYQATYVLFEKLYHDLLNQVADSKQIVVMGDSAGGQIALSFAQLLKEKHIVQPGHIVLISPVLDATMQHPEIPDYLKKDRMVGVDGSVFLVEQWAGDTPLDNYKVSPINGDLDGLGRITLTVGTKEVLYPDALNLSQLLSAKGIEHDFIPGYYQFHIYPVFPIPERRRFLYQVKNIIN
ncbi:TPA: alpha/beta hydrolase [Staphylococcus aureus]|nr:alpha/beta hydrolase [Staphylococcus aureus]HCY8721078.1 alpha/beta hydrolase [Staphylococcus aureus]HCY9587615.1 alpha/beta hydrolase [Staphylococcus aureus]